MNKKIIIAGILGAFIFITWMFVLNAIFGFQSRMDMKQIEEEGLVYEILNKHIVDPGRYIVNPELSAKNRSVEGEAVFSVLYGGVGHEAAGNQMIVGFILAFFIPTLAAWLLAQSSEKVLSSYFRKLLFFTTIGIVIALFSDLNNYGIARYPLQDALIFAGHNILLWTLMGAAVAFIIKPLKTD